MSLLNIAFLVLAVSAFTLYGLVLFVAWLLVEVLDKSRRPSAATMADAPVEHEARKAA